ncbi:MAG TPA: hypothetical protein PKY12_11490, partial [Catalimonadaceae bacterium]|nr:hypothetical protein [Catalimonadaceae bacterium]
CFGVADRYRSVWQLGLDFERMTQNLNAIKRATPEQVMKVAEAHLNVESGIVAFAGAKPKF